jgi:serine/threonine protein kinase
VYKAQMENNVRLQTSQVVVKAFKLSGPRCNPETNWALLRRELHVSDSVDSPHVMRYVAQCRFKYPDADGAEYLALVMKQEDMKLAEYLHQMEELDEVQYANRTRPLYKQLIKAYQAVHGANIIHLDVKPDNTLLSYSPSGEAIVKICDFGLCRFLDRTNQELPVRRMCFAELLALSVRSFCSCIDLTTMRCYLPFVCSRARRRWAMA